MHSATRDRLDRMEAALLKHTAPEKREALQKKFANHRIKEEEAEQKAAEAVERVKKNPPSKGARWTKPVGQYQEISLVKKGEVLGTLFRCIGGWNYEMPDKKKTRGDTGSSPWHHDLDEAKATFRKMIDDWAIELASVPEIVDDDEEET
ncbi:hypothetical protein A2318_01145 [Candidatus Uhrbacteria bacterium RIFOXYB2_FULL_45_11]|uniref:Uncharacterized protein n=1 Tax=Candidatus Uhrbacteria bacterium RIFOXYB2_FULL_45_11 TaxID=1802421 RepID=A0A1F7WA68_9BACT|nr:MAG: hypothetical protein A2318_01145 [Candidatus Uhrbacteria bacterium RIFOXYB2_FULL_45_11]